jgi:hypothetical protein
MAIAFVKNGGTASSKAVGGATSLSVTVPAGGHAAGNVVVLRWAADLIVASGTAPSVTDSRGNTWVELSGGTTGPIHGTLASQLTTALQAGDTITLTWANGAQGAMAISTTEFSGVSVTENVPEGATSNTGGSTTPSVSVTPTDAAALVFSNLRIQGPVGGSYTEDGDSAGGDTWHTFPAVGTTGGSASSNASCKGAYKITTSAVAQTHNPTIASRPWHFRLYALEEAGPVNPTDSGAITSIASLDDAELLAGENAQTSIAALDDLEALREPPSDAITSSTQVGVEGIAFSDSGSITSSSSLAGAESFADATGITSLAAQTGLESEIEIGALSTIAAHDDLEARAEAGQLSSIAQLAGNEQISSGNVTDSGTISSASSFSASESFSDAGALASSSSQLGLEAQADAGALASSSSQIGVPSTVEIGSSSISAAAISGSDAKGDLGGISSSGSIAGDDAKGEIGGSSSSASIAGSDASGDLGSIASAGAFAGADALGEAGQAQGSSTLAALEALQALSDLSSIALISGTTPGSLAPDEGTLAAAAALSGIERIAAEGAESALSAFLGVEAALDSGAVTATAQNAGESIAIELGDLASIALLAGLEAGGALGPPYYLLEGAIASRGGSSGAQLAPASGASRTLVPAAHREE